MNILAFYSDNQKLKILSFCLESQLNLIVYQAQTLERAMSHLLGEEPIDLIVAGESENLPLFIKYLASVGSQIPIVLTGAGSSQIASAQSSGVNVITNLSETNLAVDLPRAIKENYQKINEAASASETNSDSYCRINVDILCDVTPLAADLYVRLSTVKYVKIFKAGAIFTERDLERLYGLKKIDYLYLLRTDTKDFIARLQSRLTNMQGSAEDGDEKLVTTVAQVQETLHDLTNKLGFTPEVVELAKSQVDLTLKMIGKFPRLSRIIEGSHLRNINYTSKHSIMVAHVACAIACQIDWRSDSTFQKLIIAAFLHDLTLKNPEHAKIKSRTELQLLKERVSYAEYQTVEGHPFSASQLVDKLTEIPGDVYLVVLQHHERPDGLGFPRGLTATTIAPLAAVFIAAHDLVDDCLEKGDRFNIDEFWNSRLEYYGVGTFKKIARSFQIQEKKAA